MSIYENLTEFNDKPIKSFKKPGDIKDFAATAPRLACEYDEPDTIQLLLSILLEQPGVEALDSLVIGLWSENGEAFEVTPQAWIELLVAEKTKLPNLEALFSGDITSEENEISWIMQGDMSSIWAAFPALKTVAVRGGNGLRLGKINHSNLQKLVVQTGGLPVAVIREALEANAPLTHLELWLGDEGYGANSSVADFTQLMEGKLFPELKYLGLCNSQYSDDLAKAIAQSAIIDRLEVLDLSSGTLKDKGADALLASGKLGGLKLLDIHHHFLSPSKVEELKAAVPKLIANDPQEPDEWDDEVHYYVAVSE